MYSAHTIEVTSVKSSLAPRLADANKGHFGSVAIIGGSNSMQGALLLAARASQFSGAGKVYACSLADDPTTVDPIHPEIMFRSPPNLIEIQTKLTSVVIGPGLGMHKQAMDTLSYWLQQPIAMLIDADALNLIAQHPALQKLLKQRQTASIITPHPGEAARLLNCDISYIQDHRIECAVQLTQLFNVICVLKGAGTICVQPDGTWFINSTGNVGLASAGTGDVLSGIIGSLVAQGIHAIEAAKLGVYVHGAAADVLVAKGIGPIGLTASEIALETRNILNQLNT